MKNIKPFPRTIPNPTVGEPLRQLEWIFSETKKSSGKSKGSAVTYVASLTLYKQYLREIGKIDPEGEIRPYLIKEEWDTLAFFRIKTWAESAKIQNKNRSVNAGTRARYLRVIRRVMHYAYMHNFIEKPVSYLSITSNDTRETDSRKAYSNDEVTRIFDAFAPVLRRITNALEANKDGTFAFKYYVAKGTGKDPRVDPCIALHQEGEGWRHIENIRWYFENVLDCKAITQNTKTMKVHQSLFRSSREYFGSLNNVYALLGLKRPPDLTELMSLVLKLSAETGLNAESLFSLRRNCLQTHPLTGLPVIEYNKTRSGGDKELTLILYDKDADTIHLGQKQSQVITRTVRMILALTEPLVELADEEDREYLLLYRKRVCGRKGVTRLRASSLTNWYPQAISAFNLTNDAGGPLRFNLSRFRPTKITQMVVEGYDVFDIMSVCGHASILTTFSYIDELKTTDSYHSTVTSALSKIKENRLSQQSNPLPTATAPGARPGTFLFKGSICSCKDPYDPPQEVKSLPTYRSGDACSYFNMCLKCKHVLITEGDLPKLISYRNEIANALANGIDEIPRQGTLYKANLAILDSILVPDEMFSRQTLDLAAHQAETNELGALDSFVYQGSQS